MNITDTKKLGAYIKNVRKEQHLTQADLAIAANVGVRFLVDLENGKETAQIGKVINVCRALGITIDVKSPYEKI
ncbi:MAG TPA: helix-turn-helix transcriptional regulator [Candidatus Adamsella sp.]|nr:helix-turn-helix transcriptional regulator [Candidatus Adamsella sp.]